MSNALIFGGMAAISLFVFFNLGKIKASKNQTNRNNRINRFGNNNSNSIIDAEVDKDDKN